MVLFHLGLIVITVSPAVVVAQIYKPWILRPNSNSSYQFNSDENGWVFARENCLAQNADLVSIGSAEELFYPIFDGFRERFVIVGLFEEPVNSGYRWADGYSIDEKLTPWITGNPKPGMINRCVTLEVASRKISNVHCDVRTLPPIQTRYVCEKSAASKSKGTTTLGTSSTELDWAVFLRSIGKMNEFKFSMDKAHVSNRAKAPQGYILAPYYRGSDRLSSSELRNIPSILHNQDSNNASISSRKNDMSIAVWLLIVSKVILW